MTVVGVDFSTFKVNTAWIKNATPCRWHIELDAEKGQPRRNLIDRVRSSYLQWPLDVECVAIEYPVGRSRSTDKALMAVVGAITRAVPKYATVAWPSTWDVRNAIGSTKDTKEAAHAALVDHFPPHQLTGWDEHELDALVVALGYTIILNAQENA